MNAHWIYEDLKEFFIIFLGMIRVPRVWFLKKKKKKGALIFYKVIHTEVFMDEI